jgi:hypothetical protein
MAGTVITVPAMSNESFNPQEHGVLWSHAFCFRSWRAYVGIREQILTMDAANFAAFERDYTIGNRAARPRVHLDLEDVEAVGERSDGWRLIAPTMGPKAVDIDQLVPLMEHGVEAGIVMRWQDREGDLWGDVVWRHEGEETEAYETRQGKARITAMIEELSGKSAVLPAKAKLEMIDPQPDFVQPTAAVEAIPEARMATAPGEGDGGVP